MLLRLLIADKALLIAAFLLLELCLQLRELSQALACFIQFLLLLSQLLQSMGIFQQSHALIALCGQLCLQRGKFFFLFLSCVIKLLVLMFLYYMAAAVMQPVCDKRLVACMTGAAAGHGILLKIVGCSLALFSVTIAVLCASTNAVWYAG